MRSPVSVGVSTWGRRALKEIRGKTGKNGKLQQERLTYSVLASNLAEKME